MKKMISVLSASIMMATSLTTLSVSAVETNELSVVKTPVTTNIVADDGTVIPAGAVAINVNIENNTGFSHAATVLELGNSYNVILNEDERPVVSIGEVLGDSLYSTNENDNRVAFVNASGDEKLGDGLLFTIYAYEDASSSDNGIIVFDTEEVEASSVSTANAANGFYICGDVTDDDRINSSDSSQVLAAINKTGRTELPYNIASALPSYYLPYSSTVKAAYLWGYEDANGNPKSIGSHAAEVILDYYSAQSANKTFVPDPEDANGLLIGYAFPL